MPTSKAFTVIIDTKEKHPWSFTSSSILEVKYQHLETGDYTVEGLERVLCIERKRSVIELAQNINEERFARELKRMSCFPYKYILLESSIGKIIDYPLYENIPDSIKEKVRINGSYILKCLNRMQVKYGVNIVYCETAYNAVWIATNLMKEVIDQNVAG